MQIAEIDFTTQEQQQAAEACDTPTQGELNDMIGIGSVLKTYHDAERSFKEAKATFVSQFDQHTALRVVAFRDAYWTPKSHATVCIKGVEMTWDDFVNAYFGVDRSWLNKVLKRVLAPSNPPEPTELETLKTEIVQKVKAIDDLDEATALLGQIDDGFETDEDEGDEPTLEDVPDLDDEQNNDQPTALELATARINELEEQVKQLTVTADEQEVMTEKEKVVTYAKRISGGRAHMLKLFFEEVAAKLGLDDRMVITVE